MKRRRLRFGAIVALEVVGLGTREEGGALKRKFRNLHTGPPKSLTIYKAVRVQEKATLWWQVTATVKW